MRSRCRPTRCLPSRWACRGWWTPSSQRTRTGACTPCRCARALVALHAAAAGSAVFSACAGAAHAWPALPAPRARARRGRTPLPCAGQVSDMVLVKPGGGPPENMCSVAPKGWDKVAYHIDDAVVSDGCGRRASGRLRCCCVRRAGEAVRCRQRRVAATMHTPCAQQHARTPRTCVRPPHALYHHHHARHRDAPRTHAARRMAPRCWMSCPTARSRARSCAATTPTTRAASRSGAGWRACRRCLGAAAMHTWTTPLTCTPSPPTAGACQTPTHPRTRPRLPPPATHPHPPTCAERRSRSRCWRRSTRPRCAA
jgi:hypothetical protein